MAYETGIISSNGYIGVLEALRDFVTKANSISAVIDPTPANTGGGDVTGVSAEDDAPTETWTLTCTTGGATGIFSVVGSISGARADATVGTPYVNDIVAFTINDGTPDFVAGETPDDFEFTVTKVMGTEKWTVKRDKKEAEPAWQTPTSSNDPTRWYNEEKAYNGDIEDAADNELSGSGWDQYLELYLDSPIECDKIRFAAFKDTTLIKTEVDVYYEDDWHTIYSDGTYISGEWFEVEVGSIKTISKARIRFYTTNSISDHGYLYEFNFNNLEATIENIELILMAPGSEGSVEDEYFVGIKTAHGIYQSDPYYIWMLNGFTGYNTEQTFYEQAGSISTNWKDLPLALLDITACQYWIVANGRRVTGCIKVGTTYSPFYLGLLLPYGTPNTLPYPLVIGGSAAYYSDNELSSSCAYYNHRGFFDPYAYNNDYNAKSSLKLLHGVWLSFGNHRTNDNRDGQAAVWKINNVWPGIYSKYAHNPFWPNELKWSCERNIDDTYPLFPFILMASLPYKNIFGELDGVYAIWGDRAITEDDIIFEGKTYKVFQNCLRTYPQNFWALRLE